MKIVDRHGHVGIERPERHESTDAATRPVWWFLAGLLVFILGSVYLMVAVFRWAGSVPLPMEEREQPSALFPAQQVPPSPRLQTAPQRDLYEMRRHEDSILTTYGWVDQKAGVARIPIDRAMDLLLKRGVPARADGAAVPQEGKP